MSGFGASSTNLSSKSNDQSSYDAVHSTSISPLLQLDLPTRPESSLRTYSDDENTKQVHIGTQRVTQVDGTMNVSDSNFPIAIDKLTDAPEDIDSPTDSSHEIEEKFPVGRPPFAPFFTLIKTADITAHPRQVHYLFSDDDTNGALTSTILRLLFGEGSSNKSLITSTVLKNSSDKSVPSTKNRTTRAISTNISNRDSGLRNKKEESCDKRKDLKSEKRVIIVDLNSTGDGIANVSSLSSKWQVLGAQIEKAPTWNGADDAKTEDTSNIFGNMMLKIDGVASSELNTHAITSVDAAATLLGTGISKGTGNSPETKRIPGEEEMRNLVESFEQKMSILRRVIGTRSRLDSQDTVVETGERRVIEDI